MRPPSPGRLRPRDGLWRRSRGDGSALGIRRGDPDPPGRSRRGEGRTPGERRAGPADRRACRCPCQLGGGVRDQATIAAWLDAGLDRVIVGTQALRDPDWFRADDRGVSGPAGTGAGRSRGQGRRRRVGSRPRQSRPPRWPRSSTGCRWPGSSTPTSPGTAPSRARTWTPRARWPSGQDAGDRLRRRGLPGRPRAPGRLPIAGCIVGRALYEGKFSLVPGHQPREAMPPRRRARGSSQGSEHPSFRQSRPCV